MADLRLNASINSIARAMGWRAARGTPDGAMFTADWYQALAWAAWVGGRLPRCPQRRFRRWRAGQARRRGWGGVARRG